ncbi:peptide ABC transporter substrate-binding protein [Microbacterium indicum]|uniref:peptide ABC transporter substrate-binding protein n=1 Tax=Microbacterium indicum TaxID=358100 RepID=UPI00040A6E41|nr:ABC transporter substrate-binding protein [Microbacterium indicum]
MKRNKIALSGVAVLAVGAFALAGCSSDTGSDNSGDAGTGSSTAIISTNGSEPQNPLIPTNTTETGGGKIVTSIFDGLIVYNADGSTENAVAESITTDSPTQLTVKLREGLTFTDGEEVTADNFINAWNYGANLDNAQSAAYFFEDIEGYSADEAVTHMSGLEQVDDYTFTITLSQPASDFAQRLGYTAFVPLPDAAFSDIDNLVLDDSFGENPIGNGPYMLDGDGAWQHDTGIDLVTNPDYDGPRTPQNGGLHITFYASQDSAYADLQSDQLDVLDAIPDSAFETYETDLEGRSVNQPAAIFQSITIPQYLEHFQGEEGQLRRQAISMAINREQITDVIFQGTRTPATDFTSPTLDGYTDQLTGSEVLDYNESQAQDLWAQADAISPYDGTFYIAYNADGGHQAWVDATANSISNVLGIDAEGKPYADFASLLADEDARSMDGAFRSGWQADYPGLYNFLAPLYTYGAGSNYGDYNSSEFEDLLNQGITATDEDTANDYYHQAEEVLLKDLPVLPLWYSNVTAGWSSLVDNVEFGWDSVPLYYEITKSE